MVARARSEGAPGRSVRDAVGDEGRAVVGDQSGGLADAEAGGGVADDPGAEGGAVAVELHDPAHPASRYARDYKIAIAARLTETAREAGATDPEQLGEQLALLIDGAAARTRVLNSDSFPTAAAIAAVLIDNAIPAPEELVARVQ